MTFADMPVRPLERLNPQPSPGVYGTCVLLFLSLPIRVFADAAAEGGEPILANTQTTILAPAALTSPGAFIGTINIEHVSS